MTPTLTIQNLLNGRDGNSESFGERRHSERGMVPTVKLSDFKHVCFGQYGADSTLLHAVMGIIALGAKEKVAQPHAFSCVAVVQHEQPVRNGTMLLFPNESMSANSFPAHSERAITGVMQSGAPVKAPGSVINLAPKSVQNSHELRMAHDPSYSN